MALGLGSSTFLSTLNGVRGLFNFITASAGATSAGQGIGANAAGDVDVSFMPVGPVAPLMIKPPTGNYRILNALTQGALTTLAFTAGAIRAMPIMVSAQTTINQLGASVSTGVASSTFSIGIYADNGGGSGGNAPAGNPLCSVSGLSSATASNAVMGTLSTPYVLQPGIVYWLVIIFSSTATFRILNVGSVSSALGYNSANNALWTGLVATGTGSTLPNLTGQSWTGSTVGTPVILMA